MRDAQAPDSAGPSWLTVLGHAKDSLWSLDLFRCESAILRTHWVLVVMDQCTRRIVGFGVHRGGVMAWDCAACSIERLEANRRPNTSARTTIACIGSINGRQSAVPRRERNQDRAVRAALASL